MSFESLGTPPAAEEALVWFVSSWEIALLPLMLLMSMKGPFILVVDSAQLARRQSCTSAHLTSGLKALQRPGRPPMR
jgi:hypothetical protein